MIDVQNVRFTYDGANFALDGVSLHVRKGEFLCIVGPTGCGKTTFLNSLTKLYDITAGEITICGEPVDLTLKEFNLLKLFLEHKGLVFSREKLLSEIWGEQFMGETRTVDVHIGTLRSKLGKWGDSIRTVRGVGYRMEDRL